MSLRTDKVRFNFSYPGSINFYFFLSQLRSKNAPNPDEIGKYCLKYLANINNVPLKMPVIIKIREIRMYIF
jgi:hypothetical protein